MVGVLVRGMYGGPTEGPLAKGGGVGAAVTGAAGAAATGATAPGAGARETVTGAAGVAATGAAAAGESPVRAALTAWSRAPATDPTFPP